MPLLALLKVRKSAVLLVSLVAMDSYATTNPDFTVCGHWGCYWAPPSFLVT